MALEDAIRDYRDAAARRIAADTLERAWRELVAEPEDLLVEIVSERAETICGFRPLPEEVIHYLRSLRSSAFVNGAKPSLSITATAVPYKYRPNLTGSPELEKAVKTFSKRNLEYNLFGTTRKANSANEAFVEILKEMLRRDPHRIEELAEAVRGTRRNHIARTEQEIYPNRPDLARAVEICPGWLVGLNIANREKMKIIREACELFKVRIGSDLVIEFPNVD